jgi:hypothetical protein
MGRRFVVGDVAQSSAPARGAGVFSVTVGLNVQQRAAERPRRAVKKNILRPSAVGIPTLNVRSNTVKTTVKKIPRLSILLGTQKLRYKKNHKARIAVFAVHG